MAKELNYTIYKSKQIQFLGERRSILLKNDGGDCCLLAICNALALRNDLILDATDKDAWELDELLVEKLLEFSPEHCLNEAMLAVPKLDKYVPDPTSDSVECFKNKSEIFEGLRLHFYHGWMHDSAEATSYEEKESEQEKSMNPHPVYRKSTDFGVQCLKEKVEDNQIFILYHDGEFHTATKFEGEIYMLVTYDFDTDIRWVTCDVVYVGEDFTTRKVHGSSESEFSEGEENKKEGNDAENVVGGLDDIGGGSDDVGGGSVNEEILDLFPTLLFYRVN